MKSVFNFIVKPVGERYDNEVKVNGKSLILNTKIESFKSVNNLAEVEFSSISLFYKYKSWRFSSYSS